MPLDLGPITCNLFQKPACVYLVQVFATHGIAAEFGSGNMQFVSNTCKPLPASTCMPPPAGVCNTACFLASRAGRTEVAQADLVAAVEQTKYGKTYEASKFVSPGRKQRFAVIEAGFCLAASLLPAVEPIDYVTILPSIKSPIGRTVLKVGVQPWLHKKEKLTTLDEIVCVGGLQCAAWLVLHDTVNTCCFCCNTAFCRASLTATHAFLSC